MTINENNLISKFNELVVNLGIFESKEKLEFRARQIFGNIDLNNKKLLEVGCGDGVYSIWANLNGAKPVIGLEPELDGCTSGSRTMFLKLVKELRLNSIECMPQTIDEFNPNGIKFDVVLSNMSINHLDEDACIELDKNPVAQQRYLTIFKKLKSIINPRGKLIILDNSNRNFFAIFKRRSPFCPDINWRKHQTPETWIKLLKQTGFIKPKISWRSRYYYFLNLYCPKAVSFFIDSFFRIEVEV